VAQRIEDEHRHFADAHAKLDAKWLEEYTAHGQQVSQLFGTHGSKLDSLSASVSEHYDYFSQLTAKHDHKHTEKNSAQDEAIAAHYQHFTGTIAKTVSTFSTELSELERHVSGVSSAQDKTMDGLSTVVAEHYEQLTNADRGIEKWFSEQTDELNKAVTDAQARMRTLESRILANVGTRALDLDAGIEALEEIGVQSRRRN
jgi:uncharacterized coiled-coil protein SlyX